MKISEVAMFGAKFAYGCCNNVANLNACGYASNPDSIWGKLERTINGSSIKYKETGFKSEIFCVALGAFFKRFYNHFLGDNEDSTKSSFLTLYVWHNFPVIRQEGFFSNSASRGVQFCMSTREYMFYKHPYDANKLEAFLHNTIWYIDSGSIKLDSDRARDIDRMITRVINNAYAKANNILNSNEIVDDIGFTKATSDSLDFD